MFAFKARKPVPPKRQYPRRLLIYHTGTFETATMGMSKLIPVFFFIYGTLGVAPMLLYSPDYSSWLAPLVVVGSAIPMVLTAIGTISAVVNITLHLPSSACRSEATLQQFLRKMPGKTVIEITGMRLQPWPKTKRYFLEDLRTMKPTGFWNIANLERAPPVKDGKVERSWMHAVRNQHYVRDNPKYSNNSSARGVWPVVMEAIESQTKESAQPPRTISGRLDGEKAR
ncbi:hypothetical protein MBLNU457_4747t2 [Dothideomycetes sp. NU457]